MPRYDPDLHRRRSIRLPGFNYASAGWYFVTICVQGRMPLLGTVEGEAVRLSPAGRMVRSCWEALPERFPRMVLDACVIMPDHVHGVIGLVDGGAVGSGAMGAGQGAMGAGQGAMGAGQGAMGAGQGAMNRAPTGSGHIPGRRGVIHHAPNPSPHAPLGEIVRAFKARCTRTIRTQGIPFAWQRNYWERVVRSERELDHVRWYVATNPARWDALREVPAPQA